jgi:glycosyltransferase involved in cell wall biosynthesis
MRAAIVDILCNSPYYCAPLVRALRDTGVEAELASPAFYREPHYLDDTPRAAWVTNLTVYAGRPRAVRLASRSVEASLNVALLLARVAAGAYDVVHVQWLPLEDHSSMFMRLLRHRCDATDTLLVRTVHNAIPHDRPRTNVAVIRRNLDLAHLLVAQTDHLAAELIDTVHTVVPIEVVPHGPLFVDRDLPDRAVAAARLGIRSSSGPIVLFLGLLRPYKGLDLLADAWPVVKAAVPEARLLVVGSRGDRGVEADLNRLRGLSGVEVDERYVSVQDMLDYHAVCDVVVLPYRRISQSGALMTAIGLGRPTVLTPLDGLLEQVRGLESVVVATEVSAHAVADAIVSSLRLVDELAQAAVRDRELTANASFGWRNIGRATADVYQQGRRRFGAST